MLAPKPLTTLEQLRRRFPGWDIVSPPAEGCRCNGTGAITTSYGLQHPCLCVGISEDYGVDRAKFCRAVGEAAREARHGK